MKSKPNIISKMEVLLLKGINPRKEQQFVIEILRAWIQIKIPNLICENELPNSKNKGELVNIFVSPLRDTP